MEILLVGLALIMALLIYTLQRRETRRLQQSRDHIFDGCEATLSGARVLHRRPGFPVLVGHHRGVPVRVELIYEALAFRKVPVLWLSVTVAAPTACAATLSMLARPQNTEFYSACWDLPYALEVPPGTADHAILRCSDPAGVPDRAQLLPHLAFFRDHRAKELVVSPRGVRLVRLGFEAEKSYYLVLRQGRFQDLKLEAEPLAALVEQAVALHASMAAPAPARPALAPVLPEDHPKETLYGTRTTPPLTAA